MSNIMKINKEDVDTFEKRRNYTVSIIECGKIGIPLACLFAEAGFKVVGVSTNLHTFEMLEKGRPLFVKNANLEKFAKEGTFTASSDARKTASESDVIVIAVQSSVDEKKKPDYSLLEKTCKDVGMGLKKGSLVIFISPTGPGVVDGVIHDVLEKSSGLKAGVDFGLAYSPDQINPPETRSEAPGLRVVGAVDRLSLKTASLVLGMATKSNVVEVSNIKTAEAVNLFQTVKNEADQALANELALLCERLKIDIFEVLKVADRNGAFHLPLPGMMDSSARRDLYLLQEEAENANMNLRLTNLARRINDNVAECTFRLVKDALKACNKTVRRAKVSVLGVSRYPNVKETPGASTKNIIKLLKKKLKVVQVYDPFFSKKELTELGFEAEKLSKVVEKTDCLIILTGHDKFARLNLKKVRLLAKKSPAIVDISHVIDPSKAEKQGFVYRGLGRGVWTK
jgi:nucleotide sugar dehydrogenase